MVMLRRASGTMRKLYARTVYVMVLRQEARMTQMLETRYNTGLLVEELRHEL
jgi:hypothetical protein